MMLFVLFTVCAVLFVTMVLFDSLVEYAEQILLPTNDDEDEFGRYRDQ
jgi:hypothetical protein